jgi:hypothetical protein
MSEGPLEPGKATYTRAEVVWAIEEKDKHYQVRIKNQKEGLDRLMNERSDWIRQVAQLKEELRAARVEVDDLKVKVDPAAIWTAGWKDGNDWAMYEERSGPGDYRLDPKNPYDGSDPR